MHFTTGKNEETLEQNNEGNVLQHAKSTAVGVNTHKDNSSVTFERGAIISSSFTFPI